MAVRDIDQAVDHYLIASGARLTKRFVRDLHRVFAHLSREPSSGSLRYAHELNLPGLRSWELKTFPYLVFYVELSERVDVWRVLHTRRDLVVSIDDRQ